MSHAQKLLTDNLLKRGKPHTIPLVFFGNKLLFVVVVPDEQTYASESQQELESQDDNVNHNG